MQVGVDNVTEVAVFFYETACFVVYDKFFIKAVATCCFVICVDDIAYSNAFRAVLCSYPFGVWKVTDNSGIGIFSATEHGSTYNVGCHTFNLFFLKSRVNG